MIQRTTLLQSIRELLRRYAVVGLVGARQVGKTTLARQFARASAEPAVFYDLESPDDLARLAEPMLELRRHRGLIVLDEIQRRPELFPALRVLADERPRQRRFLVLGSAAPPLLKQGSETLAGRIAWEEVPGLSLSEIGPRRWEQLWLRGGFPDALLSRTDAASLDWRRRFRQTFVERDIPQLELPYTPASSQLLRFWGMLAHVHGSPLNWSELGRSMGVSDVTVRRYTDLLEGARMVRQLRPWHENLAKRQMKAPRLFFRDSGLLHLELGVRTMDELLRHPRLGASWEGFLIEQVLTLTRATHDEAFFWRTQHGAEVDLLIVRDGHKTGIELKRASAPKLTPSMSAAVRDLKLERLYVVHAGSHRFSLAENVEAVPWQALPELTTTW